MYLKFIELFGFKTFPDKIRIPFDTGINIIVGPNGCGKTNIVDAIRFILGEQTLKDLRLRNMNDIIFHGSNLRGQSSVALCRGVFVNDPPLDFKYKDFSEIMVERRHFKNKETEYRINGFVVPYREYLGFFNEGGLSKYYSIVDSSKINALLNYKPNDLRLFFEEASGITKYKTQKKSASKKLEAAQLNLLRINDLYGEVERQLTSLKGQSEVLEKYKELEKEKRLCDYVLYDRLKRKINSDIDKHNEDLDNYSSLFTLLTTKTVSIENNLTELKTLADNLNDKYKLIANEKNKILIDITKLNSDIDYGTLTIKKLESEIEKKNKEISEQNDIRNRNAGKLGDYKNKELSDELSIKVLYEKLNDLNAVVAGKKESVLKIKGEAEIINDDILDITEKSQNVNNKLIFNVKNIKNIDARIYDTEDVISKISREIKTLEDSLAVKNDFAIEAVKDIKNLKERQVLENEKLLKSSNELEALKLAKDNLEKGLVEIDVTISKLSDFITNREGFSEGTKRLLNSNRDYEAYPLSDLLEAETGFENIIWAGFEDLLEAVVVKDIEDAKKALDYLNNDKAGQAKIFIPGTKSIGLPRKDLQELAGWQDLLKQKGIVPLQGKIILNQKSCFSSSLDLDALGMNFYYSENAQDILDYIKQTGFFPEVNIITNDGVIFLSNGFIIAGKNKNAESQNLFINKKKLSEYKNLKADKEKELNKKNLLFEEMRLKIKETEFNIDKLNKDIRSKEMDELTAKNDIKHIDGQIIKSKERLNILKRELENLESEKAKALKEDEILKEEQLLLENELKIKSQEKLILETKLKSFEDEFENAKENELKLKIEINSAEQNLNFLKKGIKDLEGLLQGYSKRLDNLNLQVDNIKNEIKAAAADISSKQKNVEGLNEALKSKESEIKALEVDLESTRDNINNIEKDLENAKREKSNIEKKRDTALTYINMYKEKLAELNLGEFSENEPFNFSDAEGRYDKLSEEGIKKNIEELRIAMSSLGDINMNATNEYGEALNRLDFLLAQKTDLEGSIKSLENIIKKLDIVSKEKFSASLKQIRLKFNELFVFLFGGGHADILNVLLEDRSEEGENDIQGMEINVQIPGKKFSGINILSQGEKVLVAISLLFSIFLVKKTPFCVIDEVDAPLDYANNARYNRLIGEISNYSQVILITHNKKTMEIGKNIFGVTSKQPGISKIVSVSMN
ncbi:MAG: chromosome segregation protein SMC [Deltaproteobacteria bacterium]|jgi:chromosome segregation protein|nr:chromosome segregation protein SMC [Deltaproteobacteria bacterium]MCL5879357.1 chromosome segregation protein SMC [Deltaproteobacteria bacterium]MDA8304558.1 chromosome segregation protein SMC [Deltaproteobacteria bacterium]